MMRIFISTLVGLMFCFSVHAAPFIRVISNSNRPSPAKQKITLTKKLDLKGSRGETLNFMVKLNSSDLGSFAITDLKQKKQDIVIDLNPHFYSMETLNLTQRSYDGGKLGLHYDPLIPVNGEISTGGMAKMFWGEITIPRDAPVGIINGKLRFAGLSVPFKLKVWKMEMPEVPAFPMYGSIEPWSIDVGHYLEWRAYADFDVNLINKYFKMLAEHKIYPLRSWSAWPEFATNTEGQQCLDLNNYPTPELSYYQTTISKTPEGIYYDMPSLWYGWPGVTDLNDTHRTEPHYKALNNSLKELGHPQNAISFFWDEPLAAWISEGKNDIPLLIQYASQIKSWAPTLKLMSTMPGVKSAAQYIDIFVPAPDYFGTLKKRGIDEVSIAGYRELQRQGKEIWWYVSCMSHGCSNECKGCNVSSGTPDMIIDRNASYIRTLAWLGNKYNLQGFFYYNLTEAYQSAPGGNGPWNNIFRFGGNGDGTLIYPGRPGEHGLTEHQPIPSVRMKIWRETTNDFQYVKWMKELRKKPKWWSSSFNALVKRPRVWEKRYMKYQNLRDKVGEFLNKR